MIRATLLGTAVLMTLTGCARVAESRFNPLNWFGSSQTAPADFGADGSTRSRQISAAYILDRSELAAIRSVRVQGATDARVSRR